MGALRYCFGRELRRRWRAWLALAVLLGLSAGPVFAAAAAARRTATAYDRFREWARAPDVVVGPIDFCSPAQCDPAKIRTLPVVLAATPFDGAVETRAATADNAQFDEGDPDVVFKVDQPGAALDRSRILRGRSADPSKVTDATVSPDAARALGVEVGDTLTVWFHGPPVSDESFDRESPPVTFTIVGIELTPDEMGAPGFGGGKAAVHLTPAFDAYDPDNIGHLRGVLWGVRLAEEPNALATLQAGLQPLGLQILGGTDAQLNRREVEHSTQVAATTLWALAALGAFAVLAVLGQAMVRQVHIDAADDEVLRAIGLAPAQLRALRLAGIGVVAAAGTALAVVTAAGLSPLGPIGLARTAEPHPGFALDGTALGIGAAAVMVLLPLTALPAVWRARRPTGYGPAAAQLHARLAVTPGLSPAARAGVGLATSGASGRSATPMLGALVCIGLAVSSITGALVFGASLDRLLRSPPLYGRMWDVLATPSVANPDKGGDDQAPPAADLAALPMSASLGDDPDVAAFAVFYGQSNLDVGTEPYVPTIVVRPVKGDVLPPVVAGRLPAGGDEVAVGGVMLDRLGKQVGDTVEINESNGESIPSTGRIPARIVGEVVVDLGAGIGRGVVLTVDGSRRLGDGAPPVPAGFAIRFSPGADPGTVLARHGLDGTVLPRPAELENVAQVRGLPRVFAGLLAAVAAAALAHALVVSARRRAREVAVLKCVGFLRRHVRATFGWTAATLALGGGVLGAVLGVAAGRVAWTAYAHGLDVAAQPLVPLPVLVAAGALSLAIASGIGLLSGRRPARIWPAPLLRSE